MRVGAVVTAVATTLVTALLLLGDRVGLDRVLPFAVFAALRIQLAVLVAAVAVAVLVVAAARTRRREGHLRPALLVHGALRSGRLGSRAPRTAIAAVPALVVALVAIGLVVPRTVATGPATAAGTPLTVLELNAYEGHADLATLAAIVRAERPDVVVVPEAGALFRSRIAPLVPGYRSWTNAAPDDRDVRGVVILTAPRAGDVTATRLDGPPETRYPWAQLTGGILGPTRLIAVHLVSPVPGWISYWPGELESLQRWCAAPGPSLVVGDLNSSADHSAFRAGAAGCTDAATQRGAALTATWRAGWPRWFGAQIDHVLMRDGPVADDVRVLDVPGSDHRALLVHLTLSDPG